MRRLPSNIQTSARLLLASVESAYRLFPSKNLLLNPNGSLSFRINPFTSITTPKLEPNNPNGNTHSSLVSVIRKAKQYRSLRLGKIAHAITLRSRLELDLFVCNNLLNSYWICGSIRDALRLFGGMLQRDVISWNTMISGSVSNGLFREGLWFLSEMSRVGIRPTQSSFASILVACGEMGSLNCLKSIHCFSIKSGFSSDCCVGNALLKGYVRLGELQELWKLSDDMTVLDEISFEIMLQGFSHHEMFEDTFSLFRYSCLVGAHVGPFATSSLISSCTSCECKDRGIQIHGFASKAGLDMHASVFNSLITMYSRLDSLEDAENLFDWSESRDIVTWNSLISGYAYNGEGDAGVCLIQRLLSDGFVMNESTFRSLLSCSAVVRDLNSAKKAHALILKLRKWFDHEVDNVILTMYCKCDSRDDAVAIFRAMETHDIVSLNLMMGLYKDCGKFEESVNLFFWIRSKGFQVDEGMLSAVIFGCTKLGFLDVGRQVHGSIIRAGLEEVFYLKNSLLEFYSQVGRIEDMERVFSGDWDEPDLFAWNTMLMGYAHHGLFNKSIHIWQEMQRSSAEPNEFSYSALLHTCGCGGKLLTGEQIHACIQKKGLAFDTALMNTLLTMYSIFGMMDRALLVFQEIASPDPISWNAVVAGYSQNGFAEESVEFHKLMTRTGIETNYMTFASILMSCAMLAELKLGSQFHVHAVKRAYESELPVSNSLITMYSRCGQIHNSTKIFQRMVHKDVITWNSMISALAHHGHGREAIRMFEKMKVSDVKPNNVTFIGILSACSCTGLVSEACYQFNSMQNDHGVAPSEEHYICMVDILCRAGRLAEAKDLIEGMPFGSCSLAWRMLLNACKTNENVKLGEVAAKKIMHSEPWDSAPYVLLSDLYASTGDVDNKVEVRKLMEEKGVKKETGYSWILN